MVRTAASSAAGREGVADSASSTRSGSMGFLFLLLVEGACGAPTGQGGVDVEHPGDAGTQERGAEINDGQAGGLGDGQDRHHRAAFDEGRLEEHVAAMVE